MLLVLLSIDFNDGNRFSSRLKGTICLKLTSFHSVLMNRENCAGKETMTLYWDRSKDVEYLDTFSYCVSFHTSRSRLQKGNLMEQYRICTYCKKLISVSLKLNWFMKFMQEQISQRNITVWYAVKDGKIALSPHFDFCTMFYMLKNVLGFSLISPDSDDGLRQKSFGRFVFTCINWICTVNPIFYL